ncbi:MAG: hypothetical protein EOO41_05045, partial [Methanobacteriota archaeon]
MDESEIDSESMASVGTSSSGTRALPGAATLDGDALMGVGGGSGVVISAGGKSKRVTHSMAPETRSLLLHRQAIATGSTGIDMVSAAANLSASGQGLPPPSAFRDITVSPPACAAAGSSPVLDGAWPPSAARRASSVSMGDTKYDCVSIVHHMGALSGGHYIAFGKNRINNKYVPCVHVSALACARAERAIASCWLVLL